MKALTNERIIAVLILALITSFTLLGQDTIKYKGLVHNSLLYESFELYPDSTFKWTLEYDLSWDEYGKFKFEGNLLVLDYYIFFDYPKTMSIKDSIRHVYTPDRTEVFIVEDNLLYRKSVSGKKIKRMKFPSLRTRWSWIYCHRHKYIIVKS